MTGVHAELSLTFHHGLRFKESSTWNFRLQNLGERISVPSGCIVKIVSRILILCGTKRNSCCYLGTAGFGDLVVSMPASVGSVSSSLHCATPRKTVSHLQNYTEAVQPTHVVNCVLKVSCEKNASGHGSKQYSKSNVKESVSDLHQFALLFFLYLQIIFEVITCNVYLLSDI
jgi:hypothetical protein